MKAQVEINAFNIYLNSFGEGWGIDLMKISWDTLYSSSLFKLCVMKYGRKGYRVEVDVLYLRNRLQRYQNWLADKKLWNKRSFNRFEQVILNLLNKVL